MLSYLRTRTPHVKTSVTCRWNPLSSWKLGQLHCSTLVCVCVSVCVCVCVCHCSWWKEMSKVGVESSTGRQSDPNSGPGPSPTQSAIANAQQTPVPTADAPAQSSSHQPAALPQLQQPQQPQLSLQPVSPFESPKQALGSRQASSAMLDSRDSLALPMPPPAALPRKDEQ